LKHVKQAALDWLKDLGLDSPPKDNAPEESTETFDIRWRHIVRHEKKKLFSKPVAACIEIQI